MKRVLLDANVFIRALNHGRNTTEPEHREAVRILEESLQSENVGVVLTP